MAKEGDVVLVYVDNQPAFFARIESIEPDIKPEWFQVKMLVLQIPMIVVTWILREAYIDGTEFTMGGRPIRITPVVAPSEPWEESDSEELDEEYLDKTSSPKKKRSAKEPSKEKVVSLVERKNKKK